MFSRARPRRSSSSHSRLRVMPDCDGDRAILRVMSDHPVIARQIEQHAVRARDRREAVAGADALHPRAGRGRLLHDRHQLVLGGRATDRGGSAGLVPGPVGPGRPALHAHDRNLVVGCHHLGDGVLAPWAGAARDRGGMRCDPDLGVGPPRAHPSPPRRARAGAPDRRQRRGGPHHRRRRPPQRLGLRPLPRGEPHGRRAAAVRVAERQSARRRGARRRCEPIPTWRRRCPCTSPSAFAEGTDYDLGVFAGPDPALFTRDRRAPHPRGAAARPVRPPRGADQPVHPARTSVSRSATRSRSGPSAPEQFGRRGRLR